LPGISNGAGTSGNRLPPGAPGTKHAHWNAHRRTTFSIETAWGLFHHRVVSNSLPPYHPANILPPGRIEVQWGHWGIRGGAAQRTPRGRARWGMVGRPHALHPITRHSIRQCVWNRGTTVHVHPVQPAQRNRGTTVWLRCV